MLKGETLDEVTEVRRLQKVLERKVAPKIAEGVVAEPIDDDKFWDLYPSWTGEFKAGGLLGTAEKWECLLGLAGIHFPAAMRRWLDTGHSAYVNIHKIRGKSPKRVAMT